MSNQCSGKFSVIIPLNIASPHSLLSPLKTLIRYCTWWTFFLCPLTSLLCFTSFLSAAFWVIISALSTNSLILFSAVSVLFFNLSTDFTLTFSDMCGDFYSFFFISYTLISSCFLNHIKHTYLIFCIKIISLLTGI